MSNNDVIGVFDLQATEKALWVVSHELEHFKDDWDGVIDNYKHKVNKLDIIIIDKNKEIEQVKRKKEESDEAFSKLLKKFKK